MTDDEVREIALAIAKTNGHPTPEEWAETVTSHFNGTYVEPQPEGQ